jgi:hypothetical protein
LVDVLNDEEQRKPVLFVFFGIRVGVLIIGRQENFTPRVK